MSNQHTANNAPSSKSHKDPDSVLMNPKLLEFVPSDSVSGLSCPSKENSPFELVEALQKQLLGSSTFDDLMVVRDDSELLRTFAQKRKLSFEVHNAIARLKIDAERRLGTLLAKMDLRGGDRKSEAAIDSSVKKTSLEELGINRNESSRWQREARIPEEEFVKFCHECEEKGVEISTNLLLRTFTPKSVKKRRSSKTKTDADLKESQRVKMQLQQLEETKEELLAQVEILKLILNKVNWEEVSGVPPVQRYAIPRCLESLTRAGDDLDLQLKDLKKDVVKAQ